MSSFEELVYVLWYHRIFGSAKRGKKLLAFYKNDYEELYNALINDNDRSGTADEKDMRKIREFSPFDAYDMICMCREEYGWDVISCDSPYYPSELKEIGNYPHILFCDGKKEALTRAVKFAVVGSRDAHPDAEVITRNAAYNLTKTGALIVSGAAMGIDSSAHLGAIEAGGETIAVLGCGLGSDYMKRMGDFYDRIRENGVFVTEMFPFENATRYSFPERNRIISGMSKAVLVACAAEKSGSLITAETAKKQGRRVYAFAPDICYSSGCKKLIDEDAYVFYNAGDMAYPFKDHYEEGAFSDIYCNKPVNKVSAGDRENMALPKKAERAPKKTAAEKKTQTEKSASAEEKKVLPEDLSDGAVTIYELLDYEPVVTDSLASKTGLPINQILMAVCELETELLIKTLPGGRIQKLP